MQARIRQELSQQPASDSLDGALKETLRLYPAVHLVARTALRDVTLGPYLVRRGEEVVLPLYVMQRLPELFPRPDDFVLGEHGRSCAASPLRPPAVQQRPARLHRPSVGDG